MTEQRMKKPRRKRGAQVPKGPTARKKPRKPRDDTLKLEDLKEYLTEQLSRSEPGKDYPCKQAALALRRPAAEAGDLVAMFSALQWCRFPIRFGFSYQDAELNPDLDPREPVVELPQWLHNEMMKLLWRGLHGTWPAGKGRSARPSRQIVNVFRDLVRAAHVLKARKTMAWEDVFEHVAQNLDGAGTARAVEAAYDRVAAAFREDPSFYRFLPRSVPREWDP